MNTLNTASPIRIGVLGAAAIVPMALTDPARAVSEAEIVAIAARDPKRAQAFARKHRIPRVHQTYRDLLADPQIDAVYNPLPNSLHAAWTIRALKAGKHVLCEKPFASNAQEAEEMAGVARETGLILSEAFAYRYHPLTQRLKEIIASGELGKVLHLEAHFCFLLPSPKKNIRFQYELAGGALMDCGCYPVSLIRFLAEAEPRVENARASLFASQVDHKMSADLSFADGRTAHLGCDMLSPRLFRSSLRVQGDSGTLHVINPYHPHWFHWLSVRGRNGSHSEHVRGENVYTLQLRAFIQAIRGEVKLNTDPADAVNNMRVVDAIYEKAGLKRRGI
ncbi:MAG TPA: Gfo/Idh/MocA family oxidoreductase [Anaerolineales bacterium]|nr:Gfo/Idh/MocA family oxidoreductase [Anaerolineales bacterium]